MESYVEELSQFLTNDNVQSMRDLFEWLMQPCLGGVFVMFSFEL